MMKQLLLLLFFFSINSYGQIVSGIVIDSITEEPLEGASIYFEGTTYGTISDKSGGFKLKVPQKLSSNIVISFLGYKDIVRQPFWHKQGIIAMERQLESLDEVIITAKTLFSRKQMLRVFKSQFLGNTTSGKESKILNEEDIYLEYDEDNRTLKASSERPIVVINNYLGYEIQYRLQDFKVIFSQLSLNPIYRKQTSYSGSSFFKEFANNKKYRVRRERLFRKSSLYLMRIVAQEDWGNDDFTFYYEGFKIDPSKYFEITGSPQAKKVIIKKKLTVTDKNQNQSGFIPQESTFIIDGYGNTSPSNVILYSGQLGEQRIGDTLPLDYGL